MAIIIRSVENVFYIGQSTNVNNMSTLPFYGSIEKADNYFSMVLHGMRWSDTNRTRKLQALVSATKRIDRLNFIGVKTLIDQPLQFPRGSDTKTPVDIEEACYELALTLLKGIDPDIERDNLYINSQAYGPVKTDYNRGAIPMYILHGIPNANAWDRLFPYLLARVGLEICRAD